MLNAFIFPIRYGYRITSTPEVVGTLATQLNSLNEVETIPGDPQVGDIVLFVSGSTAAGSWPNGGDGFIVTSGYTDLYKNNNVNGTSIHVAYKRITDPAETTITTNPWTNGLNNSCVIQTIRGVDPDDPIDNLVVVENTGGATDLAFPALQVLNPKALAFAINMLDQIDAGSSTNWNPNGGPPDAPEGYSNFALGDGNTSSNFNHLSLVSSKLVSAPEDLPAGTYSPPAAFTSRAQTRISFAFKPETEFIETDPPEVFLSRIWRLSFPEGEAPSGTSGNIRIREVEFFAKDNLAGGDITTPSTLVTESSFQFGSQRGVNTVDNDTASIWTSLNGAAIGAWLQYDMEFPVEIGVVRLRPSSSEPMRTTLQTVDKDGNVQDVRSWNTRQVVDNGLYDLLEDEWILDRWNTGSGGGGLGAGAFTIANIYTNSTGAPIRFQELGCRTNSSLTQTLKMGVATLVGTGNTIDEVLYETTPQEVSAVQEVAFGDTFQATIPNGTRFAIYITRTDGNDDGRPDVGIPFNTANRGSIIHEGYGTLNSTAPSAGNTFSFVSTFYQPWTRQNFAYNLDL